MFFFFFLIFDPYFLFTTVIIQMFNPTAELVIPTGIATNEVNAEVETQPVIVQSKISKTSKFKYPHVFLCFSLITSLCCISSKI